MEGKVLMSREALVTGVAGFIGSHLAERLVQDGWRVTGIDCLTDYYAPSVKMRNLATLLQNPRFRFVQADLLTADLQQLLSGMDVVFHEAGQAGVRGSWGSSFDAYVRNNVLATQRVLEASKNGRIHRFVYASSSSIYGDAEAMPITEKTCPRPISPYGMTKLVGEQLCDMYWTGLGVAATRLRYFTVYGPRQRPDMAFHRFVSALMRGERLTVYGDGEQTRDFTFITDVVEATVQAMEAPPGSVFNVAGGARVTVNQVINALEEIVGRQAHIERLPEQPGDQRHTWADTSAAREVLGYRPQVGLQEGLSDQVTWMRESGGV